jgi:hypothetical protein
MRLSHDNSELIIAIPGRQAPVAFAEDCIGERAAAAVNAMKPGDILCLENTRFHPGEERNDPAFVAIAALGDIFVNDAFSVAHRAHASVEGIAHRLPTYAGRTMQDELEALTKVLQNPIRPLAAIVGGSQGIDQARPAWQPARKGRHSHHRRWHGQYPSGRARIFRGQIAVRARSPADHARDHGQGEGQRP